MTPMSAFGIKADLHCDAARGLLVTQSGQFGASTLKKEHAPFRNALPLHLKDGYPMLLFP